MAYGGPGSELDIFLPAAADLSTHQYKFVKMDANGRVNVCVTSDDIPVGIQQNKPGAIDQPARIRVGGVSRMFAGEALNEGALLASDSNGRGTATTAAQAWVGAVVLTAVGGSADFADVRVCLLQHV